MVMVFFCGCSKFLDEKPSQKLATISTKEDLWALLNNENIFNSMSLVGEDLSDNYYLMEDTWNSIANISTRNKYTWEVSENDDIAWSMLYLRVYYANVVLENALAIKAKLGDKDFREISGTAKFYRSLSFFELMTLFSLPYIGNENSDKLGISLRLSADIDKKFPRSSIKECYEKIIADLKESEDELPALTSIKTRPSKLAVKALLARIYLSIGNYDEAFEFSRRVLEERSDLLDYSKINGEVETPFKRYNLEVIHWTSNYSELLTQQNCFVDTLLYNTYQDGDYRKKLYFREESNNKVKFRGTFAEDITLHFTGSTTAEMYLTFAEASLKVNGKKNEGKDKLNYFLKFRYHLDELPKLPENDSELRNFILNERRKEFIFRNRRFEDVRRLNLEGDNIIFVRRLAGREYKLTPKSSKYALLIPLEAIKYSGFVQNQR